MTRSLQLVQYLGEMQVEMKIYRNDQITLEAIADLHPERILISPGPCSPKESGLSNEIIRRFSSRIPTLGVCWDTNASATHSAAT
jgi:anthranilate/para-aminobenzoate synthase component II